MQIEILQRYRYRTNTDTEQRQTYRYRTGAITVHRLLAQIQTTDKQLSNPKIQTDTKSRKFVFGLLLVKLIPEEIALSLFLLQYLYIILVATVKISVN